MGNSQRKLNGETMTAYVRGKRGFEFRDDWPEPKAPTKDEVVLKVSTAAINPVDYKLGKGMLGEIVGLDVCGVVEAVGDQSPFKVGDKVYGRTKGSLAQKTITKSSMLSLAPSNLSIDAIAAIPTVYVTGLQALRDHGGLQAGGSVLVIGASGGCGLAGVQIAKALGAGRVVGVCSGKNRELVLANGADAVVDYTKENFWDMPDKFDLVYDTATNSGGNEEYKLRALSVLKTKADSTNGKHGQYVAINGSVSMWIRMFTIGQKANQHIFFVDVNSKDLEQVRKFAEEGVVKPIIAQCKEFSKAGLEEGYQQLQARRTVGKIVYTIDTTA